MIIWIFLAKMTVAGSPLLISDEEQMKYAFTTKEACEYVIGKSEYLVCIPITLVQK